MPFPPGTRLGTYEIVGTLGAGGMGEVYRAKDLRLGREVAVKVLPSDVASNPDRLARFEREARTVAGLNHPNIVTLHSVEDEDGVRFLTMELVEGQTLSDLIVPGGLPFARVLELSIALSDALVAAHERGVIHRDLKPANVMLTRGGRLKVLDFGLAKLSSGDTDSEQAATVATPISNAGQVLGTVPYMAPEQLRGEGVDARTDLFAFGILLYEMATGNQPFSAANLADTSSAILRDSPKSLTSVRGDLPSDLERITSRCLEKNPSERFQSALDVNNELRRMRKALERGEAAVPAPASLATVAVLPFVNRSANADDAYFSEGLADELINVLAKIKGLRVSARTSSFHFKGKDVELGEIGKALRVATVLEGSVRKAGNRLRVSVQLVKVEDGFHLWSETYDRTFDDIFAVQDDIAHSVVKELRSMLLGEAADSDASGEARAEVVQAAKGRAADAEAYRLFLLARHLKERRMQEDLSKALQFLKEALRLDPAFALAWAELAGTHSNQAAYGWAPAADSIRYALEAAERALSLEPDLAEAHSALAWIRIFEWDWPRAQASSRRALELAPGNARSTARAAVLASNLGRLEEAIGLNRQAVEQDPLRPGSWFNLGLSLNAAGRLAEAEAAYRKAQLLFPQFPALNASLALNLAAQGKDEEALAEAPRDAWEPARSWALAIVHAMGSRRAESDRELRKLLEHHSDRMPSQIAEIYAAQGEGDKVFQWLERAYAEHDAGLAEIMMNPRYRPIHGDPRWGAFIKKMGFEERVAD